MIEDDGSVVESDGEIGEEDTSHNEEDATAKYMKTIMDMKQRVIRRSIKPAYQQSPSSVYEQNNNNVKSQVEGYECWREFTDKLTEGNVDKYVDLPMIAVMGDTSSGKSSLLSNISLVELPSSDSLTTRCPIRLQMRHAESKCASVKVVWKYIPKGADDDSIQFAVRTVGEDNWNELTSIIAEAQKHIIQKSGKEVARDMVCVDMKGPHCENLTLIDLPGIVRSSGKGESASLAEDIQALMNDYLKLMDI